MAKTFSLTSAAYSGRYLKLECTQTPNIAGNYSDIAWTLTVTGGSSNYYSTGPTEVKIGGTSVYSCARKAYSTKTFPAAKGSTGGTHRVYHSDADGSCTVAVSLSTAIHTATVSTVSGNWTLDSIAPATDANIESASTVVVTKKNTAFTHSIAYRFGNWSGYVSSSGRAVDAEEKFSNTPVNFTLPENFYTVIPYARQWEGSLTCYTYSGNTLIGTSSCKFTATADRNRCAPTLEASVEDVNAAAIALTGDKRKLIRYISTARCHISAAGQKSAVILSKQVEGHTVEGSWYDFVQTEHSSYTVTVTDSREYSTGKTVSCQMIPYVVLTANAAMKRENPTGSDVTLTITGNCYKGSFGAADNTLQVHCQLGSQERIAQLQWNADHTYSAQTVLTGLDYTKTYTAVVTVTDAVTSVKRYVTIKPGTPVFDWGGSDFAFHVPVTMPTLNGMEPPRYLYCYDANEAYRNGIYRINENSLNTPNQNGLLLVFRGNEEIIQIAMDYAGANRKIRMIWYGTIYEWKDW